MEEINITDIVCEALELKRLAGNRAHVFFWLSGHLYDQDLEMKWLESGLFSKLCDYDWHGRLMFGTDLPVWQANEKSRPYKALQGVCTSVSPNGA